MALQWFRRRTVAVVVLSGVLLIVVVAACAYFIVPYFVPWTKLNCEKEFVDINTGRLRFSRYALYCKVSERVEDSSITKALPPDLVATAKPRWWIVNTFSPGLVSSPPYSFHNTISQIRDVRRTWEVGEFSDQARRKSALHIIALWKLYLSYDLAGKYISVLGEIPYRADKDEVLSRLLNLDMPVVEKRGDKVIFTVFYPDGTLLGRFSGRMDQEGNPVDVNRIAVPE